MQFHRVKEFCVIKSLRWVEDEVSMIYSDLLDSLNMRFSTDNGIEDSVEFEH